MGSLGSPGSVWKTPTRSPYPRASPFSNSVKQRSRTEGGSCNRRRSSGAASPGRFIPRRYSMDLDAANFSLQTPNYGSTDWSNEVFEDAQSWGTCSSTRQQRTRMARLSLGATEKKILTFKSEPFQIREQNPRRPSDKFSSDQMGLTFTKPSRKLPKYPIQVLDLPKLADDYFTHTMCWSSDGHLAAGLGSRLYTCSLEEEGTTLLRDLSPYPVPGGGRTYTAIASNSAGNLLAACTSDSEVQIWDLTTLKISHTVVHTHSSQMVSSSDKKCPLVSLDWRPKEDVLAVGCSNGIVEIIDLRSLTSSLVSLECTQQTCISGLKFSPHGGYLATSNSRHKILVWDMANLQSGVPLFVQEAHYSAIRALSWYPFKNSILASGGGIDDGMIKIWNIHAGRKLHEIAVNAQVCEILWSQETKELLTSQSVYDKHSVVVWDYPTLNKVGSLGGHTGRVLHMALSPDKTQLATAAADETLRIWQLKPVQDGPPSTPNKTAQSFIMQGLR